jgi:hypothetical protein
MRELGIDVTKGPWVDRSLRSDPEKMPTLETSASKDLKTVIVMQSSQDDDTIKKATWTEKLYDNLKEVFGTDLSDLSWIVRHSIGSIDRTDSDGNTLNTQKAIDQVFGDLQANRESMLTLDHSDTDKDMQDAINLLNAQTHVARVLQFLKDYHTEMGNKKIAKLHVMTDDNEATIGDYIIVIELTPVPGS